MDKKLLVRNYGQGIMVWRQIFLGCLVLLMVGSCASYKGFDSEFRASLLKEDYEEANDILGSASRVDKRKWRLLYYLDKGSVLHLQGDYAQSNEWLERAYIFGEDYYRSAVQNITGKLLDAQASTYRGEEHEHLLVLYLKALNYLLLGDVDKSLIEVRRLDVRFRALEDRYKEERHYRRDAFLHLFTALVYEASGNLNDALVSYKNAYDAYTQDYTRLFGMGPPSQLVGDLYHLADSRGRLGEFAGLAKRIKALETEGDYALGLDSKEGTVICFWNNYPGPVKGQQAFTFIQVETEGGTHGAVAFESEELDLVIPWSLFGGLSPEKSNNIGSLSSLRLALPQYLTPSPTYSSMSVSYGSLRRPVELAEDMVLVAKKTLHQRLWQDVVAMIVRVGLKKTASSLLKEENEVGRRCGGFAWHVDRACGHSFLADITWGDVL